ncbi:Uncharacterised protein [Klebsiella pneumoniae]|nr:Uncharacterised protein [Klebsiella pneumoniae]
MTAGNFGHNPERIKDSHRLQVRKPHHDNLNEGKCFCELYAVIGSCTVQANIEGSIMRHERIPP